MRHTHQTAPRARFALLALAFAGGLALLWGVSPAREASAITITLTSGKVYENAVVQAVDERKELVIVVVDGKEWTFSFDRLTPRSVCAAWSKVAGEDARRRMALGLFCLKAKLLEEAEAEFASAAELAQADVKRARELQARARTALADRDFTAAEKLEQSGRLQDALEGFLAVYTRFATGLGAAFRARVAARVTSLQDVLNLEHRLPALQAPAANPANPANPVAPNPGATPLAPLSRSDRKRQAGLRRTLDVLQAAINKADREIATALLAGERLAVGTVESIHKTLSYPRTGVIPRLRGMRGQADATQDAELLRQAELLRVRAERLEIQLAMHMVHFYQQDAQGTLAKFRKAAMWVNRVLALEPDHTAALKQRERITTAIVELGSARRHTAGGN